MADTNDKLPFVIRNKILPETEYSRERSKEIFNQFIEKLAKLSNEDPEAFSKVDIHFTKTRSKITTKQRRNFECKKLSRRKRKMLGLYDLGKKSMKYKDLLPLHELWKEYMTTYMNLEELKKQKWSNSHLDSNFDTVSLKLYRADYHGCIMTVVKSECPSYVGKTGIIVMETKNCFKLLGSDDILRTIPKTSSLFKFELNNFEFSFFGKNFQVKPADRTSRKLKTVYTSELQL